MKSSFKDVDSYTIIIRLDIWYWLLESIYELEQRFLDKCVTNNVFQYDSCNSAGENLADIDSGQIFNLVAMKCY